MKKGYFKIALRNILHHRLISIITIIGLSTGLAGSMFIYLWVSDELSFDRFNVNSNRLYRVEQDQPYTNGFFHVSVTPSPAGPVWKEKIPEIENSCRITYPGNTLFRYNDKVFYEEKVMAADSTFFTMFSYKLTAGDRRKILRDPQSIVISDEMAKKYFGDEDAVGKSLQINNSDVFLVAGIMKKMPSNSSFDASFIVPYDYMKKIRWYADNWSTNAIETYVLLSKGSNPGIVKEKIGKIVKENNPETTNLFMLFPFLKMHLHSYWGFVRTPGGIVNVWILSSIALLVLIVACINFMNLSTARSTAREKETGLRKLNGAYRRDLVLQFFVESFMHAFTGLILAFGIVSALLGPFNLLTGKSFSNTDLFERSFILGMVLITFFTAILAGSYPAFALSSFKPIDTLKAGLTGGTRGRLFRKVSVVIQFAISIILILFTIVTYRQLKFMQNKSLGFDKENLIYVQMNANMKASYPLIKQEFLKDLSVMSVTASTNPPQNIGSSADNIWWEGKSPELHSLVNMAGIDFDYVETMGIKMKAGRPFSKDYSMDLPHDTTGTFLINEQLEKLMGIDNAVGKALKFGGTRGLIVGVMSDFNFQSLRTKVEPLALWIWPEESLNFIYFRVRPGNLHGTITGLGNTWNKVMPQYPFEYHFVDQEIDKMYRIEQRTGSLLKYFSILAILIACIGLFGLATYSVERRTRELGLRKALGASGGSIISLISDEFLRLLLIASAFSLPLSLIFLRRYLSSYGYHIRLDSWIFFTGIFLAFIVAGLAVSYQLYTAIRNNPARSLKYE